MIKKNLYFLIFFTALLFSCSHLYQITSAEGSEITAEIEIKLEIEQEIEQEEKYFRQTLTLVAAGDNLFHMPIINSSRKDGAHDFAPIYSEVKDIIKKADLAFINQETVMAGESFGYSGYPNFNTPQVLANTLADTGFNIVNIANNHTMDMGEAGLLATLDFLDTIQGITVIGARKEGESRRIVTKNNITLGFLSYTYALNGYTLPAGNPNLVSLIRRNKMTEEINALRPLCDFLIVSMHWGAEYMMEPGKEQTDLALFLAEHNVDLIIGHHPHVLQRFETLSRPDGKETFCFYSIGNFVSNQNEKERILGALIYVTFVKESRQTLLAEEAFETLLITNHGLLPVVCHFESGPYGLYNTKVYPIYLYSEELLKKHWVYSRDKNMTFDFFNNVLDKLNVNIIREPVTE